jgi:hypothetical protein
LPTTTDVNVELAVDRLPWDLDLILLIDVGFVDLAAAVGASIGQGCLVDLVDSLRRLAVGLGAVLLAGLASWFLGVRLGWSFGEGGGLTLASALLLFKQAGEAFDLGFQFGDAALQRLAAGTSEFVHEGKIAKCAARSFAAETITSVHRLTR